MQGFKPKSAAQLAWNKIKRAAYARASFEAANYREQRIDELLAEAWPQFEEAYGRGEILALEAGYDITSSS